MSYNLNYELDNEQFNDNISLYNHAELNKLEIAEKEDLNHFSCKAILFYILSEINHDVICNYYIIGVGNVDLYDITTRTIYHLETALTNEHLKSISELYPHSEVDIIVIYIVDLPDDIFQRYLKLREYVEIN